MTIISDSVDCHTGPMWQPATEQLVARPQRSVPARICGLATAVPGHRVGTDAIWAALGELHGRHFPGRTVTAEAPRCRFLSEPLEWIMRPHSLSERTDAYREHARRLAFQAGAAALTRAAVDRGKVGLIVAVSCTGFVLPSLDAELIPLLGLRRDTARLPIAELGCGGGVAGLARAHDYLRAYPDRAVLLVAVEVPSLTFQPGDRSTDNLIAALVFGDGAGAAVLEAGDGPPAWQVLRTGTVLVPEGARDLGYELRDGGLRVILSRQLPGIIAAQLPEAVATFLGDEGLESSDLDVVIAHPGGPRILDAVAESLNLSSGKLAQSRHVFLEYGNGSSAGIFFVLEALAGPATGCEALAVAFGPGLSIELARMRFSV